MRGVVAGIVVVALAAACVVVFMGKGEKPVEKVEKERGRIKEVGTASLAERTGLSFSTVQRYVRKLRQERGIAA